MGYLVCTITLQGEIDRLIVPLLATEVLTCGLVASVEHCQALVYLLASFAIPGMCCTSLLFFYRVRAVYGNSRVIALVFGFLWTITFGASFLFPFSAASGVSRLTSMPSNLLLANVAFTCRFIPFNQHIGPTKRCIVTSERSYTFLPVIANAIYDTLVFIAISYRIVSYMGIGDGWRARTKSFFTAEGLPRLSKALLQSGQQYYL